MPWNSESGNIDVCHPSYLDFTSAYLSFLIWNSTAFMYKVLLQNLSCEDCYSVDILPFIPFRISLAERDCRNRGKQKWSRRSLRSREGVCLRWAGVRHAQEHDGDDPVEEGGEDDSGERRAGVPIEASSCVRLTVSGPWSQRPWGSASVFTPYPEISEATGEL